MAERDEFGAFLIGFVIGGLTGAAISLLMAPQSGEDTREYLKERAIELRDKTQETAQTTYDQVSVRATELSEKAKTSATELKQRGQEQLSKVQKPSVSAPPEETTI